MKFIPRQILLKVNWFQNNSREKTFLLLLSLVILNQKFYTNSFQGRHTDGQEAYEKVLNVTNSQRNANQKDNKVPPHTSQSGRHWKVYK